MREESSPRHASRAASQSSRALTSTHKASHDENQQKAAPAAGTGGPVATPSDHVALAVAQLAGENPVCPPPSMPEGVTLKKLSPKHRNVRKVDCYAFGVLLWSLWTGQTFGKGVRPMTLFMQVLAGLRPTTSEDCPPRLAALMQRCWDDSPSKRPEFTEIVPELEAIIAAHSAGEAKGDGGN